MVDGLIRFSHPCKNPGIPQTGQSNPFQYPAFSNQMQMIEEILARMFVNQWLVLLFVSILLLSLAEAGYRLALRTHQLDKDAAEVHSGTVQGAVLGLLGLLLGFSFAMAVGRYEARRTLVLEEANSIGTTWLRTDFLNTPIREEVRDLLLRYTRLRVEKFAMLDDPASMARFRKEVSEIHTALWAKSALAARTNPTPLAATFIVSLNETIDLDASRMAEGRNHVPGAVWLLLLIVSGSCAWSSGYGSGAVGQRSSFSQFVFPILIGIVITLIVDIDRPRNGLIGVSQQPMQDLLDSIRPNKP